MIVTLTLNPSLDKTFEIDALIRGEVIRISRVWAEAAGKGVNVARALHDNGIQATAVIPVGGSDGIELDRLLVSAGIPHVGVPVAGAVRANVTVVESDGTVTKLNEPGPNLTGEEIDRLIGTAVGMCARGDWLVAAGSLPPGTPDDVYRRLAECAVAAGVRVALDTSGPALAAVVDGGATLLKPNLDELRELVGRPLQSLGEVVAAARWVVEEGTEVVLVSLGAQGALLVMADAALHGTAPVDDVRNTVGAGDTMLAGYLAGLVTTGDRRAAFGSALAWARASVRSPSTTMCAPDDEDRAAVAIVGDLDLSRPLEVVG